MLKLIQHKIDGHKLMSKSEEKSSVHQEKVRELRALWDEGKASGKPKPIDFHALRREAQQALEAALIAGCAEKDMR